MSHADAKKAKRAIHLAAPLLILATLCGAAAAADWKEVQELKKKYIALAVQHAMEQQKTTEGAPVRIPTTYKEVEIHGGSWVLVPVITQPKDAEVAKTVSLELVAHTFQRGRDKAEDYLRISLAKPLDMVSEHSGLAFTVRTDANSSPEVRIGCRLIDANGKVAEITPIVPAVSAWGDETHEIYLDWAFINYADVEDAVAVLKNVSAIEITFGAIQRAPSRGASTEAKKATLTISDLRLVDYLKGSYDPSRRWVKFDEAASKWVPADKDLTLQHRCQEITSMVAICGGEAGLKSATDALDMAVRTQCWDGSFLDGRRGASTVASGEYTFGFTIAGMLNGYTELERVKSPALDEKLTIGPSTKTRREWYQQMFYRGAMARAGIATASAYRDDIIGGNTLVTGANRVLGYAIAMRMVADVITDPAKKKAIMDKYAPFMQEIADAQGKFSGGFPILGEGDMYQGKGIHYDAGYTRTHMDWLITGVVRTGDPLLVQMLKKYQGAFEAIMDDKGTGLLPMISERHQGTESVQLIMPDATYQVGAKYKLPIIAQWGYNCGMPRWKAWGGPGSGNHFTFASHIRGYQLGAHVGRLIDDLAAEPEPKDLGYLFPRQMPIWTTRISDKDGNLLRRSQMVISPDGNSVSDYKIGVGEVPATVGVPVRVKSAGKVTAVAEKLSGWPKLLPADANVEVYSTLGQSDHDAKSFPLTSGKVDHPIKLKLAEAMGFVITGPEITLPEEAGGGKVPFCAAFTLTPEKPGQEIELTVVRNPAAPAK